MPVSGSCVRVVVTVVCVELVAVALVVLLVLEVLVWEMLLLEVLVSKEAANLTVLSSLHHYGRRKH